MQNNRRGRRLLPAGLMVNAKRERRQPCGAGAPFHFAVYPISGDWFMLWLCSISSR